MKIFGSLVVVFLVASTVDASRRTTPAAPTPVVHNGPFDYAPTVGGPWGLPTTKRQQEDTKPVKRVVVKKEEDTKCKDKTVLPFGVHSIEEFEDVCCGME